MLPPTVLASTEGAPSVEQIVRQFDDVAFGAEHGRPDPILRRWSQPPNVALFVSPDWQEAPPIERILEGIEEVRRLTGLPIGIADRPEQATLRLGFFPRRDFLHLPRAGGADADEMDRFLRTSACLGVAHPGAAGAGVIAAGLIMIGTDISPGLRWHCILEELVQIMGLPNDACNYEPSLFCERDRVETLTAADRILLKVLYDPRLEPGMPREVALAIVERIVSEIVEFAAEALSDFSTMAPTEPKP